MMDKVAANERMTRLKAALAERDRAAVNAIVRDLIEGAAPIGGQWRALGQLMLQNGEIDAADSAMQLLCAQEGATPANRFQHAAILATCGRLEAAWSMMEALPPDVPDPVGSAYLRGTMAINRGDVDTARTHLERAVAANPLSGQSWLALASALGRKMDDGMFDRLAAIEARIGTAPAIEQANYFYALGTACAARGDTARAAAAFAKGAAIRRQGERYDPVADRAGADAALAGWDRARIEAVGAQVTIDTSRSILVTGLPRSGSTLVEQILASHDDVVGGEELSRFRQVQQDLGGVGADAVERWIARGRSVDELAGLYLHLIGQRFGTEGRVVDKTLEASRYLGLAAAILPQAPIVWMRRAPRDAAWSIFRTYFMRGLPWSWDMAEIAGHMAIEDALCARWQDILGDRLLVLSYEDLVTEPARWIPVLAAHCGLGFDPAMLEPHKAARTVMTASVMQVREPINRKGIGVAAPYADALAAFDRAYPPR